MNILLVSHSGQKGGATNMLLNLAHGIANLGKIHCVMPSRGNMADEMEKLGIKVHKVRLSWFTGETTTYGQKEIIDIIKQHEIGLVITNTVTVADGALASSVTNTPHIWWIHEILSGDPGLHSPISLSKLYKFVVSMSKIVIAISYTVKNELEKFTNYYAIRVIPNGIQINGIPQPRLHEPIILSAGGICQRKGQMILLCAAHRVISAIPKTRFISVGGAWDADYYATLRRMRKRLGLSSENFMFHGFTHDMDSFYRSGSVFALTSECEPFGLVLLEAMRAGLPIVATNSGGPSEIVDEGRTGYLVPIGDVNAVADRLLQLLNNPDKADQMGLLGYERVKHKFNHEKFISRFMDVIKEVA